MYSKVILCLLFLELVSCDQLVLCVHYAHALLLEVALHYIFTLFVSFAQSFMGAQACMSTLHAQLPGLVDYWTPS